MRKSGIFFASLEGSQGLVLFSFLSFLEFPLLIRHKLYGITYTLLLNSILWGNVPKPKWLHSQSVKFLNPYPWIVEKKSKTRDHHRASFTEKNPERSIESIWIFFRALEFFSGNRARSRSQNMAYIFVQHGIFPLILAYAIWNLHHSIAQLTLYLHI